MLTHDEELWEKELPSNVEQLLSNVRDPLANRSDRTSDDPAAPRDKTRVVSYRVPHNAAVQVYDYREKKARYQKTVSNNTIAIKFKCLLSLMSKKLKLYNDLSEECILKSVVQLHFTLRYN